MNYPLRYPAKNLQQWREARRSNAIGIESSSNGKLSLRSSLRFNWLTDNSSGLKAWWLFELPHFFTLSVRKIFIVSFVKVSQRILFGDFFLKFFSFHLRSSYHASYSCCSRSREMKKGLPRFQYPLHNEFLTPSRRPHLMPKFLLIVANFYWLIH